jgi:hypothetical protein
MLSKLTVAQHGPVIDIVFLNKERKSDGVKKKMLNKLDLQDITDAYMALVSAWEADSGFEPMSATSLMELCGTLHHYNFTVWKNEDIARRTDVSSDETARVKRNIDQFNQKRNDTIERIDIWLLEHHFGDLAGQNLPMRTETPGSVLDRLSILSLKLYFMGKQTERSDASSEHVEACLNKLAILQEQRSDLQGALLGLLDDLNHRRVSFKVYRQFKMYNDPNLNPQLYLNRENS